jgi:lichenan operon transcriptional antiterminator
MSSNLITFIQYRIEELRIMRELIGERCSIIIKSILSVEVLTLRDLKYACNVSERTISKDLDLVEDYVKGYGLTLVRKPKIGIWIEGHREDKEKLYMAVNVDNQQVPVTPKERQEYILLMLLLGCGQKTMQDLCDELYVSRGTLEKDLGKVEVNLRDKGLLLERGSKGVKIVGDEKKLRALIADFFMETAYVMPSKEFIKYMEQNENSSSGFSAFEDRLANLFSDIELKFIEKLIKDTEAILGYKFSDMAFTSFLINIAIAVKRIRANYSVDFDETTIEKVEKVKEFEAALHMAKSLEMIFGITLPRSECIYLTIHILCSEIHYNILNKNEESLDMLELCEVKDLCKEMIGQASRALDIDFNRDSILLLGLSMHTHILLNRVKYHMPVKNPILDSIKASYITSFQAALAASTVIKERCGAVIDENEIAYIALHFEAALERIRNSNTAKKRMLIVCSLGIGTSQLIASKLKRIFENIEIVDIISSNNIEKYELCDVDCIVTTIPLAVGSTPVIRVNPVLSQGDIENIRRFILSNKPVSSNNKGNMEGTLKIIDRDLMLINKSFYTKEDAIRHLTGLMVEKGYVEEGYYQSVLEREKIASTSTGRVALPHGDISKVYKSVIGLCTLNDKLDWDGNQVELIIILAIKKEDILNVQSIFDIIYDSISDNKIISRIAACESADKVLEIIFG